MSPWEDPTFSVVVLPLFLAGLWTLNEFFLEYHTSWRLGFRVIIGSAAAANVAFVILVAVAMSHIHGCAFNGCD